MVPVVIQVETGATGCDAEDETGGFLKRPEVVGIDGKQGLLEGVALNGIGEDDKRVGHLAWINVAVGLAWWQ